MCEWLPGDNIEPPERTDCLVTSDRDALYVAFRAFDRTPSAIRARLADRDVPYLDDTVGFMIDPFNDERRAFQFRINALGVQMDAVNSDVDRSEDWSWQRPVVVRERRRARRWRPRRRGLHAARRHACRRRRREPCLPSGTRTVVQHDRNRCGHRRDLRRWRPTHGRGYSDNHAGARGIDLTQTNRTFFLKVGYAWVL